MFKYFNRCECSCQTHFVEYTGLKNAILTRLDTVDMSKEVGPNIPNFILLFHKNTKDCKAIYNIVITNKREPVESLIRWKAFGEKMFRR